MGDATTSHVGQTRHDNSNGAKEVRRHILARLTAFSGLDIRPEADGYRIPVGSLLAVPPRLLAITVLGVLSLIFLGSVVTFP